MALASCFVRSEGNPAVSFGPASEANHEPRPGPIHASELNILVLGETGVGKSTFINSMVNYLLFPTFEDALEHPKLEYLVPSKTSINIPDSHGDFELVKISLVPVGTDREEDTELDGSEGESATQRPRVYKIPFQDGVINLIDTPGIGDTRGVGQDTINMQSLLETLSHLDSLHGIIILLKPTQTRLNLTFRYCVEELLVHLHKDAARNIMFGFTNTRASNYTPGDSLLPLRQHLAKMDCPIRTKGNMFSFESEPFRHLAAQKEANIRLPNRPGAIESWSKSQDSTKRMLAYIVDLEPHSVKETLSINRARALVTGLIRPLTEVSRSMRATIRMNENEVSKLREARAKGEELQSKLFFKKVISQLESLEMPQTVCNHADCFETDTAHGHMYKVYPTPCHLGCRHAGVEANMMGHNSLQNCTRFQKNGQFVSNCARCNHKIDYHERKTEQYVPRTTEEKDDDVEKRLQEHQTESQSLEQVTGPILERIEEAKKEEQALRDASARFSLFLKRNCITVYNDQMVAYMDQLIREEHANVDAATAEAAETKAGPGNGDGVEKIDVAKGRLEDLRKHREEYMERVEILRKGLEYAEEHPDAINDKQSDGPDGEDPAAFLKPAEMDEQGITKLVEKLCQGKEWGENIARLKDMWTEASEKQVFVCGQFAGLEDKTLGGFLGLEEPERGKENVASDQVGKVWLGNPKKETTGGSSLEDGTEGRYGEGGKPVDARDEEEHRGTEHEDCPSASKSLGAIQEATGDRHPREGSSPTSKPAGRQESEPALQTPGDHKQNQPSVGDNESSSPKHPSSDPNLKSERGKRQKYAPSEETDGTMDANV
ncbi:hypothetical protein MKZ38_009734 [Zalerion maritima]|uniref:DUF8206 domain-containing protein n=1 Tax=Zalerion maritima TaxID=339359 RepID=A0AAD5RT46_9PEZI|nr:hypothetical protein MKZ38_009734 [Zalerion maritima]